jgi:hypothetical protein
MRNSSNLDVQIPIISLLYITELLHKILKIHLIIQGWKVPIIESQTNETQAFLKFHVKKLPKFATAKQVAALARRLPKTKYQQRHSY